ncbi:hypothetical protein SERLA73DRAFT_69725 [Serpula lacrymans var. lacrymans S7.3]|uniref:Cytochrome P450 n=2 Tax=Serpula lacrymans var. lacrymans TaxID=341189 RepID=F8PKU7_SERL3|nr:uncharacterized protein SERLADRAFT_433787 [Serpula lacrymans var. lacrymans S7.9]EGO03906.1 hypothetical protein SERLA73DRAFT_69725 [Serpula lacrymans var. lacrymans S7.3]EGO29829.1 hypothetical protein SERLADRAFT_433787 [Serpula lacrymans var. lacrymans S7.9]
MDILTTFSASIQSPTIWLTFGPLALSYSLYRFLAVPSHLRHLPALPIFSVVWSYICQEPDDVRIKRLILSHAKKYSEGVVLVWMFGRWTVHVVDPKLAFQVTADVTNFPKDFPTWDLLLTRFIGRNNITMSNGDEWRKVSTIVRDAFTTPIPIDLFTSLAKNIFRVIDQTPLTDNKELKVEWSDLAQRFALDAVGYSVIGFSIDAISTESQFVKDYNMFMRYTADPLYLALPIFEKIIPRKHAFDLMEDLKKRLIDMLLAKRLDPGDDIMSFLLRDPSLTMEDLRNNMSILFIAGHDTTSGTISSMVYYLALNQAAQKSARDEVVRVLGPSASPSLSLMGPSSLPYVNACIKETLRANSPTSYTVPRMTQKATNLGKYYIPPNTAILSNMYGVHHNEAVWSDTDVFRPERFLKGEIESQTKNSWIPFSTGPRQCPAQNFVMYEMRTLASMLLREYEWTLPVDSIHADGIKNACSPFALTLPYNLDIIFRKRV